MRHSFLWICAALMVFSAVLPAEAQLSTVGKEFWVGFMDNNRVFPSGPNNPGAPDFAVLIITANENTTGAIEYSGQSLPFSLNAGQQFSVRVPSEELDLLHRNSGVVENKGIHITATGKVAVHAFNERYRSADGTVILPVGALGKDYYITSHYEVLTADVQYNGNINDESTLLVVATEDNTTVEITTSVGTLSGNPARTPFTISLNRGQSYQLKAKADLTGSRIRVVGDNADECQKIAVFGGNKWTSVGNCGEANDHLFQQAYPVNTWGTSFVHVALSGRTSGELVKVLASEDNTEVRVNGTSRGILNQGEWMPLEFATDESGKIDTSKPSSVSVFSKSMACNQPNSPGALTGDPFMITYSPAEQFLTELTFNALNLPSIVNHYVNIVVKSGQEGNTILDGQRIGGRFSPLPGDPSFQFARVSIGQGVHRLTNPGGFAANVYGFGELESYGYAAGAALNNLNFQTESQYEFEVVGEKVACLNVEGIWDIEPENPDFSYFVWDFGDGSDPKEGKQSAHLFTEPGKYEVKVTAAKSPNSCDEQEEVVFEVEVIETKVELVGEVSVCPEVEEIMYRVKGKENVFRHSFEIEGGEILADYGDSVLVKWGPTNPDAKLRILPFSQNGCPGEAIALPVVVNKRIEVTAAEGDLAVCFDPLSPHFYLAPNQQEGRGYDWEITNGKIVSGQGSPEVEVVWDTPGVEGVITYTAYSLLDNQCEGKAPPILVKVSDEFSASIQNIESIRCFGEENGSIDLEISGGVGPYSFTWTHDPSIATGSLENLPAGVYSVLITDQLGCSLTLDNLEITQPEALSLASLNLTEVSCYGKSDASLTMSISGGTAPYKLDWDPDNLINGSFQLQNMASGSYSWMLTDSNGCEIPVEFEIASPIPLQVDVRLEKPACPGGSNGELIAIPKGKSGPFIYQWKNLSVSGNYITGLTAGDYELEVTDGEGCVSVGLGQVREAPPQVRMPTGFDPRQLDGLFQGVSNCETTFELWIFNRWGQLIYFGNKGWDGMVSGEEAMTGTYSYSANYYYQLEGVPQIANIKGNFTLLR